ncbi:PREDICTED: uncharacterized protein LOC107071496 [Polistes dominula]|uniref:Uncharacterized protein LOC107071496 n=1 Tax=Polistes dominula TaxID=743375 RepID=A0ABM1J0N4_POLDO|nr:PREDICTED: uncharacterized protein LOC107071496 [Polistes dominula]XP_015186022.1 PREDICTED: uncharacterized protein LOC107071496 [Polistes dominula]
MGTQLNESYIMTRNKFKIRKIITVTENLFNESKINPVKSDPDASLEVGKNEELNLGVKKYHSTVLRRRRKLRKIKESNLGVRKCQSTVVRRRRRVGRTKESNLCVRKCHSTVVVPRRKILKKSNNNEALKIPKIPAKILRIINILRHEEFLDMVSRYLQSSIVKQLKKMKYSETISPINSTISKANM